MNHNEKLSSFMLKDLSKTSNTVNNRCVQDGFFFNLKKMKFEINEENQKAVGLILR